MVNWFLLLLKKNYNNDTNLRMSTNYTNIQIVNKTQFDVSEELIKNCVNKTLKAKKSSGNLTILLVKPETIKELSNKYYNKNQATNVLSFESDEEDYKGEIVICPSFIKENLSGVRFESVGDSGRQRTRRSISHGFEWELCHAVVHGTLHLLGIHHENEEAHAKIHNLENKIIKQVLAR